MDTASTSKEKLKKTFIYTTLGILSVCALMGIIMIFVGPEMTTMCIISTLMIFYLVTLLSMQNLPKLSDKSPVIQTFALIALMLGVLWAFPWILLVWDAFGSLDIDSRIMIWDWLWTAGILSIFCTVLNTHMIRTRWMTAQKKFFNSIPVSIAVFVAFDSILWVWSNGEPWSVMFDLIPKFFLAELILIALQVVIIQVLSQEQRRKEKQEKIQKEIQAQKSAQAKTDSQQEAEGDSTKTDESGDAK